MTGYRLTFAGTDFIALGSGALFCPARSALIIADLHLGKSERMARRGGALLPPFETRDTLMRLHREIEVTKPTQLFLLGDVFDDIEARQSLNPPDTAAWQAVRSATRCTILGGNHDPSDRSEATLNGITLRHIAGAAPDISGHYHPKARLHNAARPAFLIGQDHIILPAFGTFTGGLSVTDPALTALIGHGLIIMTGARPIAFPFGHKAK